MQKLPAIIDAYLAAFPGEAAIQREAAEFLRRFTDADAIDRKNFVGHLTASALVVNPEKAEVVLVKHKSLGRWLQPGGHLEAGDASPLAAAIRELREEAGMDGEAMRVVAPPGDVLVPMDIDSHPIPANNKKGEPAHMHHDLRYVFVTAGASIATDFAEVDDCRWVAVSDPAARSAFPRLLMKVRARLRF